MPRMLNKNLTPFMQNNSGSEQVKERLCCQGVRLIVCMSNENADVMDVITSNRKYDVSLNGTLLSVTTNECLVLTYTVRIGRVCALKERKYQLPVGVRSVNVLVAEGP